MGDSSSIIDETYTLSSNGTINAPDSSIRYNRCLHESFNPRLHIWMWGTQASFLYIQQSGCILNTFEYRWPYIWAAFKGGNNCSSLVQNISSLTGEII